jgi:hypothetical protein
MRTRHPSRLGAVTSLARRLIGAICRGRPRHPCPAALNVVVAPAAGGEARQDRGHEHTPVAPPIREDQRMTRSRATPSGTGATESHRAAPRQADPPRRSKERSLSARQIYDGSERPDSNSLQRRRSRGRSSDLASTLIVPPVAEPSAAPRRLQSLLIRGGGAPEIHVSLVASGGPGSSPAVVEPGGSSSERARESVAATEAASQSGAGPEAAGPRCTIPEQGSKRATPELGLSDRSVKKARVRSRM